MHAEKVMTCTTDGVLETLLETPGVWPSGLGFMPDGTWIVATMQDGLLLQVKEGKATTLADLSPYGNSDNYAQILINDIVVDGVGNIYVDLYGVEGKAGDSGILLRRPDASIEIVARGLGGPNGMIVTPDRRTLIVAETGADQLSAFDIRPDGTLQNQRAFAHMPQLVPDGICLDAEGAVWVASHTTVGSFFRLAEGGEVLDRIDVDRSPVAVALGGPDRTTLFMLSADISKMKFPGDPAKGEKLFEGPILGYIDVAEVDVPGAGWP